MPGYDRKGPGGQGPRTGGGFGYCGSGRQFAGRGAGRGFAAWGCGRGRQFGGGRGQAGPWAGGPGGNFPPDFQNPEVQKASLRAAAEELKARLQAMEAELAELETGTAD